jgi:putative DNA methylase
MSSRWLRGTATGFTVRVGTPPESAKNGTKLARGANFRCLLSDTPIEPRPTSYAKANAGRMGARLMAIVAEGARGRIYLAPTAEHEAIARQAQPDWKPEVAVAGNPRWFSPPLYGLKTYGDLFTPRQLVALTTFSDLVQEAIARCRQDALAAGLADDGIGLDAGGKWRNGVCAGGGGLFGVCGHKVANIGSSIASWMNDVAHFEKHSHGRHSDGLGLAEANPFADAWGKLCTAIDKGAMSRTRFAKKWPIGRRCAEQADAQSQSISAIRSFRPIHRTTTTSATPTLSDFFYVWLRKSLKPIYPGLYATLAVPKAEELVATPYRHGGKEKAEAFFLDGMTRAMHNLAEQAHPAFPVTIYYAFKQAETKGEAGTSSTGWETSWKRCSAGFAI